MANYRSNTDNRKAMQDKILRDFGHNTNTATKEQKEKAEYIAAKTSEMKKNWRG